MRSLYWLVNTYRGLQPHVRGLLLVGLFIGLRYVSGPQVFGMIVVAITVAMFLRWLLRRAARLFPDVWRSFLRRLWRIVVRCRKMLAVRPSVEFLHIATIPLALFSGFYLLVTQDSAVSSVAGSLALITLCVATLIDTGGHIVALTRFAWARLIGKLALGTIGVILIYASSATAKQFVHQVTHADPKNFPDFVGMVSAAIIPFYYLVVGSGIAILWAIVQLLVLAVGVPISQSMDTLNARWRLALHRVMTGERRITSDSSLEELRDRAVFVALMRPLGVMVFIVIIWTPFDEVARAYGKQIEGGMIDLLIRSEYKRDALCSGLPSHSEVAYLDDGYVSVYEKDGDQRKFSIRRCDLDQRDSKPTGLGRVNDGRK